MRLSEIKPAPRVLIADDDPVIRHWLTSILKSDGYEVVAMRDGREAYRLLQSDCNFKGAVFDLSMPYLDGPDLIRHMRTEKRLSRIPVLMITAESDLQKLALGFAAGATFCLPKPFTKGRLQQILGMMLGKPEIENSSSTPVTPRVASNGPYSPGKFPATASVVGTKNQNANQSVEVHVLQSLAADDQGEDYRLITELIDLYLENAARDINTIKAASLEQNETSMRNNIHALKGSSLSIGASAMAKLCLQLEERSVPDSEKLDELIRALDTEFASTRSVLLFERSKRAQRTAA
jgi:CheY-like chemotaxis protein/HPt (histidine-containing phosphotransfer) domain-containing protein